MVGMKIKVDAENYIRAELEDQRLKVGKEIFSSVSGLTPRLESFRRISFDVIGGRFCRLLSVIDVRLAGSVISIAVAEPNDVVALDAENAQRFNCFLRAEVGGLIEIAAGRVRDKDFGSRSDQANERRARDIDLVIGVRRQYQCSHRHSLLRQEL